VTHRVSYRPEAVEDVESAHDWYEAARPGLGQEFRAALTDVERLLAKSPAAFPAVTPVLRRILLHRFPYNVYFALTDDEVIVWGCLHQARHPRTWRSRGRAA